jgi:hypothetical protein
VELPGALSTVVKYAVAARALLLPAQKTPPLLMPPIQFSFKPETP